MISILIYLNFYSMSILPNRVLFTDGAFNSETNGYSWGSVVDGNEKDVISEDFRISTSTNASTSGNDVKINEGDDSDVILKLKNKRLFGKKSDQIRTVIVCKFNEQKEDGTPISQQNNGAELMSMVIALQIAINTLLKIKKTSSLPGLESYDSFELYYKVIFSDSSLVTDFWSVSGASKSNKTLSAEKKFLISKCVVLRKIYEQMGGRVLKISGDDNLADLGAHVSKK